VKIDLEKLGLQWKHADYIIVAGDTVVVVEETSRAKPEDVDKLRETIEALRSGKLQQLCGNPRKVIAVLHASRGVDPMVTKYLGTQIKKTAIYHIANCNDQLKKKLEESRVQLEN